MKVWLPSMMVADVRGYNAVEQRQIMTIIRNNKSRLQEAWNDFFGKTI